MSTEEADTRPSSDDDFDLVLTANLILWLGLTRKVKAITTEEGESFEAPNALHGGFFPVHDHDGEYFLDITDDSTDPPRRVKIVIQPHRVK